MRENCIFCGKKLGLLERDEFYCGRQPQGVCKACRRDLLDLGQEERGKRALATGRAEYAEEIETFLEEFKKQRQEERRKVSSGKKCLRCGGEMLKDGVRTFKLGEETLLLSDLNRLFSGSMDLEMLVCEDCGKVEFFRVQADE